MGADFCIRKYGMSDSQAFHLGKTKPVSEKSSCFLSNEQKKKVITTVTLGVK